MSSSSQVAAVTERADAAEAGDLAGPEQRAVVGVDREDRLIPGNEQLSVFYQRRRRAVVPVDHSPGAGFAEPLQCHFALDERVAAVCGVARLRIGVCPFAGAFQRFAFGPRQEDVTLIAMLPVAQE